MGHHDVRQFRYLAKDPGCIGEFAHAVVMPVGEGGQKGELLHLEGHPQLYRTPVGAENAERPARPGQFGGPV